MLELVLIHTKSASTCIHLNRWWEQTRGRFHINHFFEITMNKSIFDIHLIKRPVLWRSNGNKSLHRTNFFYWCKSLLKISIKMMFNWINPFTSNRAEIWRTWNNVPCVIFYKSLMFLLHCFFFQYSSLELREY